MKVKVCGLKYFTNILEVAQLDIGYVGFIFYKKSPRFVNNSLSFDELRQINPKIKKVGVFVDENIHKVLNSVARYNLDLVQLHGNEDSEYCKELKSHVNIIKAFGVNESFNLEEVKVYEGTVDYFLFDTASSNFGGSGKTFDWKKLSEYNLETPFFLSGGISEESIGAIKKLNNKQLYGLDINSKFEIEPGLKDASRISKFLNELK